MGRPRPATPRRCSSTRGRMTNDTNNDDRWSPSALWILQLGCICILDIIVLYYIPPTYKKVAPPPPAINNFKELTLESILQSHNIHLHPEWYTHCTDTVSVSITTFTRRDNNSCASSMIRMKAPLIVSSPRIKVYTIAIVCTSQMPWFYVYNECPQRCYFVRPEPSRTTHRIPNHCQRH